MGFNSAWQMSPEQSLLQFSAPDTAAPVLSVAELGQQIFHEPLSMMDSIPVFPNNSVPPTSVPIDHSNSIDAMLSSGAVPTSISPSATAASSPQPMHGPKVLYRSDSGSSGLVEPRLQALAGEVGMSGRLMSQCIKQYFRHLYPIMPILHEPSLRKTLMQSDDLSVDDKVLVLSLCGVTVTHAAPPSDLTLQDKHSLGRDFMKLCFSYRHQTNFIEEANLATVRFHVCLRQATSLS